MTLPVDATAEPAAIGHVIENGGQGANLLALDLFATDEGIELANALRGLVDDRLEVSVVTVGRRCSMELATKAAGAAGPTLGYLVPILREKRALRELQAIAAALGAKAYGLNGENGEIATNLRAAIADASTRLMATNRGLDDGKRRGMAENLGDIISALEAADRGEKPPTVTTGLPTIDRILGGGLRGSEMATAAARTSGGKSALACWIAKSACASGKKVLYASREMQCRAITSRLLSAESGVPVRISEGTSQLTAQQKRALVAAQSRMKGWSLVVRDDLRSIAAVRAEAEQVRPDLVIIDHIGIFDSGLGPKSSTYDRATFNSNSARDLAFESGAAVLVLAQVNRAGAGEEKPRLEHLKATGALEEDSGAVFLLHRLEELTPEVQSISLNLAKNRDGPLREQTLRFDAARCTFEEVHDLQS